MRLDKYLTDAGIGTRRQVKEYIRKGLVAVDGKKETASDRKITEGTVTVTFEGEEVLLQHFVYYMLNKPAGYVSATRDTREKTVLELLPVTARKDVFPVGRLDKDTEGLLLLTNDGALAHRLLSPRKHVEKQYLAVLEKNLSEEAIQNLITGVHIGDEKPTKPAAFAWQDKENKEALLTITEGRFHQVKRMFEAVGNRVLYLKRLRMGTLCLDETLKGGEYRTLTQEEIEELQNLC